MDSSNAHAISQELNILNCPRSGSSNCQNETFRKVHTVAVEEHAAGVLTKHVIRGIRSRMSESLGYLTPDEDISKAQDHVRLWNNFGTANDRGKSHSTQMSMKRKDLTETGSSVDDGCLLAGSEIFLQNRVHLP